MQPFTSIVTASVLGVLLASAAPCARPADRKGETQKQAQTPTLVTDPTCGMRIDPAKAAAKSEYKGKVYYFCSTYCKKTFDADPEGTLKRHSRAK